MASLRSRGAQLRPVRVSDSGWLYELLVSERGSRWRYRGRTPSPTEFEGDLWRAVYSQWVVEDTDSQPVGLVGLYNHMPAVAAAHLFAIGATDCGHTISEGAGLLLEWGFNELDIDKVWIETPEFNLVQFRSIQDFAQIEGQLRNFDHWHGRFWDLYILSVTQQNWERSRARGTLRSRQVPVGAGTSAVAAGIELELTSLFESAWPLDSLARIETLTILEDAMGHSIDASCLETIAQEDPASAVAALVELVTARPTQHSGFERGGVPPSSTDGPGHVPSGVT